MLSRECCYGGDVGGEANGEARGEPTGLDKLAREANRVDQAKMAEGQTL